MSMNDTLTFFEDSQFQFNPAMKNFKHNSPFFQFLLPAFSPVVSGDVLALGLGRNDFGSPVFVDRDPPLRRLRLSRLHLRFRNFQTSPRSVIFQSGNLTHLSREGCQAAVLLTLSSLTPSL